LRMVGSERPSASTISRLLCSAHTHSAMVTHSSRVVVCPLWLIVSILLSLLLHRYVIRLFETFVKVQVYNFMRFDIRSIINSD
jgi:hypothetical protein